MSKAKLEQVFNDPEGFARTRLRRRRDWKILAEVLRFAAVLVFLWIVIQTLWFLRSNLGLWTGHGPGGWLGVFTSIFRGPWSFSLENSPPLTFLAGLLCLFFTTAIGVFFLSAIDSFVRPRVKVTLGFAAGFGVTGIVFEWLAMADMLTTLWVWLAWLGMLAVFGGLAALRMFRAPARFWRGRGPEHPGWVDAIDAKGRLGRLRLAPVLPAESELDKEGCMAGMFTFVAMGIIGLITLLTFWHAVFFPETYWDSMILYLGYAKMTFEQGGFPFKAEAQVGIGLGANYPHLYSVWGAACSASFGSWSDLYQRMAAPMAGLVATMLVYDTGLLIFSRRSIAMTAALIFRAIPLSVFYTTAASDYAFVILYCAAFIYTVAWFARTRLPGAFAAMTFVCAAALHVNYLMGILALPWLVTLVMVMWRSKGDLGETDESRYAANTFTDDVDDIPKSGVKPLMEPEAADPRGYKTLLLSGRFWAICVVCAIVGSTWFVRNWALTGSPVYGFFPKLFPATVNYNPDVMESAELEWFRNGDGIARVAEIYHDIEQEISPRDTGLPSFERRATLGDKLDASWLYWQGYDTYRITEDRERENLGNPILRAVYLLWFWHPVPQGSEEFKLPLAGDVGTMRYVHSYKMAPFFMGFLLPGIVFGFFIAAFWRSLLPGDDDDSLGLAPLHRRVFSAVYGASLSLLVALLAYNYLLADFYLYQIIGIIVPIALFSAIPIMFVTTPRWTSSWSVVFILLSTIELILLGIIFTGGFGLLTAILLALNSLLWLILFLMVGSTGAEDVLAFYGMVTVLVLGFVPGVAFALMGQKIPGNARAFGQTYEPLALDVFRSPGMNPELAYRLRYGEDVDMWIAVNGFLENEPLLTHENRHLVFDDGITLVHLDDWDVQQNMWGRSVEERLDFLRERGIRWYLFVPNERNHPVNARAGMDELIGAGAFELMAIHGENKLYRMVESEWAKRGE
ncbi:MAG: hypothetical protein RLY93_19620 [Sumerlaeia bacterium]